MSEFTPLKMRSHCMDVSSVELFDRIHEVGLAHIKTLRETRPPKPKYLRIVGANGQYEKTHKVASKNKVDSPQGQSVRWEQAAYDAIAWATSFHPEDPIVAEWLTERPAYMSEHAFYAAKSSDKMNAACGPKKPVVGENEKV